MQFMHTLFVYDEELRGHCFEDCSFSDNRDMIKTVIKLKLEYFKHVYVQATCQRDSEVYVTCHDPKIYPHTNLRFLPQIIYRYALSSTLLELKPEVKVTVTLNHLVTRQGPRCIYMPNIELLP